jgi:hypothetical protein
MPQGELAGGANATAEDAGVDEPADAAPVTPPRPLGVPPPMPIPAGAIGAAAANASGAANGTGLPPVVLPGACGCHGGRRSRQPCERAHLCCTCLRVRANARIIAAPPTPAAARVARACVRWCVPAGIVLSGASPSPSPAPLLPGIEAGPRPFPLPGAAAINAAANATAAPLGMATPVGIGALPAPLNASASATSTSASASASTASAVGTQGEFEQCGGAGGGCWAAGGEAMCKDAVWEGKGCKAGFECVRQNFWYRQCLKPEAVKSLGAAWVTAGPPATASGACAKGLFGFQQQCGGKGGQCASNAALGGCNDAAAPSTCCEPGTTCTRVSEWMWQCQGQPSSSASTN